MTRARSCAIVRVRRVHAGGEARARCRACGTRHSLDGRGACRPARFALLTGRAVARLGSTSTTTVGTGAGGVREAWAAASRSPRARKWRSTRCSCCARAVLDRVRRQVRMRRRPAGRRALPASFATWAVCYAEVLRRRLLPPAWPYQRGDQRERVPSTRTAPKMRARHQLRRIDGALGDERRGRPPQLPAMRAAHGGQRAVVPCTSRGTPRTFRFSRLRPVWRSRSAATRAKRVRARRRRHRLGMISELDMNVARVVDAREPVAVTQRLTRRSSCSYGQWRARRQCGASTRAARRPQGGARCRTGHNGSLFEVR